MIKEFIMPKLGLTMEEGTIERWLKSEGDSVKEGDMICEVATEKLTNEIEATAEGILRKIIVKEGETVPCQAVIGIIADIDDDISAYE